MKSKGDTWPRSWARILYTTNPLLKKKLEEIAWAAFAGGLGVDVIALQVPGGRLVQSVSTLNEWIYDKPPGDLQVWIETSLEEMGVDQETIDLFLRQRHWTLTTQTMLVGPWSSWMVFGASYGPGRRGVSGRRRPGAFSHPRHAAAGA